MSIAAIPVEDVASLRGFNRVYTNRLGLLNERLDESPFSLTEARILYEIAHRRDPTAAEIARALSLDRGQLSRILKRFQQAGLVTQRTSEAHAKHQLLSLTEQGQAAFASLDRATQQAVGTLLGGLSAPKRERLLRAAASMRAVLDPVETDAPSHMIRAPRVGELGWIIHRQAALYAQEYGWDMSYEGLLCGILADFVQHYDPTREQAWVADVDGTVMGSIFLVRSDDADTAKLRLLYVDPAARGQGIGRALVATCIERARELGYRKLILWTNSVLVSARRIYEAAGFTLTSQEAHHSFGKDLIGQTWELDLAAR